MSLKILTAQPVVEEIKKDLVRRCESLKKLGVTPSMSVVLVGDNPASLSYIKNKKKMCEEIGAKFSLVQLPSSISEKEFLAKLETLNKDKTINGLIVQLPVSEQLKHLNLPNMVNPSKDIDGFHGINTQNLYAGSTDLRQLMPCTPKGIIYLLKHYKINLAGKHVVIVGRSLIVGKPLSLLLSNLNATVTLAHSRTEELSALTKKADILIAAIGKPHFFNETFFEKTSQTVVVDVGMNSVNGKLTGDVDQVRVAPLVSAMTPVPGGVGPMTVISLIENLITATEQQLKG